MTDQKKIVKYLLLFVAFSVVFQSELVAQDTCEYLVWSDEFNDAGAPGEDKWGYDIGGGGWGNQELQNYTNSRSNSFVKDGKLTIKALKQNGTWTSARLVTKGKGDWLYGRIEVKAKLPAGKGTWPAIWMLPTDWEYGNWPKSGEIDIMEHVGYEMGKVHGTIHTEAYNHSIGTQLGGSIEIDNVASEFHTYAIEWTENEIIWFVDGKEYYRVSNPHKTFKEWPFDKRFHLILNIAIGGTWGGAQGIDPNLEEATMEIDYVRIYKKNLPTPVINGKSNVSPGEELSFSTNHIEGLKYIWSFPEGVKVISGENTSSVMVEWGTNGGDVNLKLISDCDSVVAPPFRVSTVISPSGNSFNIPFFDTENNIMWQAVPGNSNNIELTGTTSLVLDYTINSTGENPFIYFEFQSPVDLTSFKKLEIVLRTPDPVPGSFRIDLVDVNGNVNLNDLFKINSFTADEEFHTFSYQYGQNPNGVFDLSLIKSIKIYFNYGLFGKKGQGKLEIQSVRFINILSSSEYLQPNGDLKIWPNPFIDHLNVTSPREISRIIGYNLNGQLLFIQNTEYRNKFVTITMNEEWKVVLLKIIYRNKTAECFKILKQD